jgi:hypothetical protein
MYPDRMPSIRMTAVLAVMSAATLASAQDQPPGRPGWPCAGRPDPTYVKTSEATGGQLFMFHPSEVADSGTLMAASFTHKATLFRVAGPLDEGLHEYQVTVDGSVESALFSVSIQCLQVAEIERPNGALVQASDEGADYHQFEAGRILTLARPEAGTWKIRASGRGLSFIVVQARTTLSLGRVQLLARKSGGADEPLSPVFQPGQPRTRQAVAIGVSSDARDVQAHLVSAQFEELGPITLAADDSGAAASWRGEFVVPSVPFRIVVAGTGPDGRPFVRVHAPLLEPAR